MSPLNPSVRVGAMNLRTNFMSSVPKSEMFSRAYYGRGISMAVIENAMRSAEVGILYPLTDLAHECTLMDPHLSSVLTKRIGVIPTLDWDLTPAQWDGVDADLANTVANTVRQHIDGMVGFRAALHDLAWGVFDGRASVEVVWDLRAKAPHHFNWIHPRYLGLGPDRELRLIDPSQTTGYFQPEGIRLDEVWGKFICWTPRQFREYPEREGLAPRCLYWSFMKRFSMRMRMVLTELFAVPWRIIETDKDAVENKEAEASATVAAEALGKTTTAKMPQGMKLNVVFPDGASSDIFQMTMHDVDLQMSKLVLGNTGTTDAEGNRAESVVHKTQQDILLQNDGLRLSEVIQQQLINIDVEYNFGADLLAYAPKFQLRTQPARDRGQELDRVAKVISFGVPIALDELYEISGLRKPNPNELFVQMAPPGRDAMGNPVPGGFIVVDPASQNVAEKLSGGSSAESLDSQSAETVDIIDDVQRPEVALTPSDLASIITVNEGRASAGLGPLTNQDGQLDQDGFLSITEFKAKNADVIQEAAVASSGEQVAPKNAPAGKEAGATSELQSALNKEPQKDELQNQEDAMAKEEAHLSCRNEIITLAKMPDTVNGSPEYIVDGGISAGAKLMEVWLDAFVKSIAGKTDAQAIYDSLKIAEEKLDTEDFVDLVDEKYVHGLMLGALDSEYETQNDTEIKVVKFESPRIDPATGGVKDFVKKPFLEAIEDFQKREILSKDLFYRLRQEARRRAFTVAKLSSKEMLTKAHDELVKAITSGDTLQDFDKRLRARIEGAGMTRLKPSYVENVFRTNVMSAYGNGRVEQMTQPDVLAARPYWQIKGVSDNRTRPGHKNALNKVLRADDPFWRKTRPPFGYQCRCRLVSLSEKDLERQGLEVVSGDTIQDLPDKGWVNDI